MPPPSRGGKMRRREFISVLGSALALWPVRVRAQMPTVGFVNSSSAQVQGHAVAGYRRGLEESGFIESKNVLIESRFADGEYNRLPELVADLIERKVAVIMAGGPPAASEEGHFDYTHRVYIRRRSRSDRPRNQH